MVREETTSLSEDGLELFERSWRPTPKAAVVIVHGYAEHSGRYEHVAAFLAGRGYAVHAFDLRGHGRSEGRRAYVKSLDDHAADVEAFAARVAEREAGIPLFLLGHSMGGTIVALVLARGNTNAAGAILGSAALSSARGLSRIMRNLLSLLGRVAPRLPLTRLGSEKISRDPTVVASYESDPLVYRGRMHAATVSAMIRAMRTIDDRAETFAVPLLVLHGTADELTDPEESRKLCDRAGSQDKTLKVYEGFYHELMNEPERQLVLDDIAGWLDARVG